MNIKDASELTHVPAKTIRYYEDIGLIVPQRGPNGYRVFSDSDVNKLGFIGRARALGFTIEDCRTLVSLWEDDRRESADVKRIAEDHLEAIDAKIAALHEIRETLDDLVHRCAGDHRPNCPILESIGKEQS
ncbi:Cu(I)-responsive transcriptional regulator [Palleronia abyssalis]|uniref:HTH-type transcriptional regulator HmrR n=1 Tax=Palleronia abyssalis TaxID=1501240 RepID=A0A2R8C264_9RHOB|nr:Cu(I)-responsive transcriptional regulator [Palleronia abyssalis]SPJ26416.1 HTH-type transcriptional regulator HmrR [Palleronia abyssalis]